MKTVIRLLLVSILLFSLMSCESLNLDFITVRTSASAQPFPAFDNNDSIHLEAGTYLAPEINRNAVTITGKGISRTTIYGDLYIKGNNVTLKDLTIDGDVIIHGNNADLRTCRIMGSIQSKGNNNRW